MFRAVLRLSSGGQNCIITASGIVTLNRHTVRPFTESDNTICSNNTILSSWRWA